MATQQDVDTLTFFRVDCHDELDRYLSHDPTASAANLAVLINRYWAQEQVVIEANQPIGEPAP